MKNLKIIFAMLLSLAAFSAIAAVVTTEEEAIEAAKDIEISPRAIINTRNLFRAKKLAGLPLTTAQISSQTWVMADGSTHTIGEPYPVDGVGRFLPR